VLAAHQVERQMPDRTSNYGGTAGRGTPWLVSMAPAGRLTGDHARLAAGLEPPPGGWRAPLRSPATLPHYPMVPHRGGFPDGS
jgi:hypothetical protein